jgi:hypothetical protein
VPTFPGFNSNFELDKYPPEIRRALLRVADNFYVTRSFDPEFVGNSQYFAALVRPTDETSVFLNTERELLILFTRYDTFEIRNLEAFDLFYGVVDSARVDRSIRFLVSADDNIERSIRHYLGQHPEYPIIVPMTFSAFETQINPLIKSVQKNYLVRDLFGFQSPLREEHFFFGRNDVVNSVIDFGRSGQHSSLFGLRKSGKTSTIFAIQRKSKASDLNVILIDCQDIAVHGRNYTDLLIWLLNKIRSDLRLKHLQGPKSTSGPDVSEWFSASMKITLNALKSNILLIFDEIENISPGTAASTHWRDGRDSLYFWQIIRSFCQTQAKRYLSICFVGTSPYLIETSKIDGVDNPAYLLATKRFMPNLSFDVTREMVSRLGFFMGLNFSAEAVARLHASYGGHPFFTRQVCSKVHQLTSINRPIDVPLSRIVDAQGQFSGQLESYVSDIICSLKENYPVEFDLLDKMVDGNQHEIAEYMSVMPELVDHLIGYGLVVVRDGIHELAFSAIEGAVKNLRSAGVVSLTTEAQWSTINVRRNNLEQAIRTALYLWSRTVSEAVWLDVLKVNMNSGRHARLPSTEPNLVLSKGNSPLFYTDLIALLKDGRVLPHLSSKRSEIMEQMERVNRLRRDAHANEFSQNQFADLVVDLEELESEFLAP